MAIVATDRLHVAMVPDLGDGDPAPCWWLSLDGERFVEVRGNPALYDAGAIRECWDGAINGHIDDVGHLHFRICQTARHLRSTYSDRGLMFTDYALDATR